MRKIFLTVFLYLALSLAIAAQTATIISENANLRGTPSENGKIVDTLRRSMKVDVITQHKEWFLVQSADYVGWIHGNTIEIENMPPPNKPSLPLTTPVISTGVVKSRTYIRGPKGGCYYINSKGNKTYVDRNLCHR